MPWPSAETLLDLLRTIASAAANWWIQSTLLIAAGLVVGTMCRKRGSAVQSVVYRTALAAVLAAPLVTWGLHGVGFSGWSIEMPAAWSLAETSTIAQVVAIDSTRPVDPPANGADVPGSIESFELTSRNVPSNPFDDEARVDPSSTGTPDVASETPAPASSSRAAPDPSAPTPSDGAPVFNIHLFGKVATAASAAWLLVGTALITRIAMAWRRLGRIRRGAAQAEPSVQSACRNLAARLSVAPPPVLRSPYLPSPCLAGLCRPVVLLPETAGEMPVHDVLAHELAHLMRGDCYWNLVRRLASAVLFFQPLMWVLSRRIEATAEEVCDDFVVHLGGDRCNYAYRLCDIAELSLAPFSPAGVGMVSLRSMLARRVTRIMDTSRSLSTRVGGAVLALVISGGLLGAFAAGLVGLSEAASATIAADSDHIENPGTSLEESLITEDQQRSGDDSKVATPTQSVEETPVDDLLVEDRDVSTQPVSYSGRVETPQGEPIAGAKIWLAVTSHDENQEGLLRELGTTDEQGRFEVVLDAVTTQDIRKRQEIRRPFNYYLTQLVATAEGRGLDWMPLDVFEDNPTPSAKRDTLQARIDQSLGDGCFASRTLKLRPESRPVRGRLVDLEGHRLPNVTVLVESLRQPDIPRLLKAFEMSWKREMNEAFSVTSFGPGLLARSELQKLIPPVTTDEKGEFELRGIADDQLVELLFDADRVEARPLNVLGREMETVSLPHIENYPSGAQDVFVGRDFTYAVGPSVPVEGIVTDYDTGKPVAGVLVYVERLFKEGSVNPERLRLDTHHMRAVTDEQGRFRITGMPPGEGHVVEFIPPRSEPYFPAWQDVSLSLKDGEAKRIEIQLKRGIWIEGRVTDKQSGEPFLATVDYMALRKNPHSLDKLGLEQAWVEKRYETDSDGRYRVLGLPGPGVLLVTPQVSGYPLAAGAETIDGYDASGGIIPTTPFPLRLKFSDWRLLNQIDPAADAISSTCDLALDADVSIPGRVVGPDGKPITDLYILGQTDGDEWWRPRHTDYVRATNRFEVYGYDGKGPRQLFFKNQDETLVGQYRLEGDAPEEIVVTLQPSVRVKGRLIENETNLPATRYFLHSETCSLFNEKYPPEKFRIHWLLTDDEGRFEIKGLMAGVAYKMNALNERNSADDRNRFMIDLTAAKPGDVIELGDVTVTDSKGELKN
ncbi:M56 family metallopeptidase [Lacipirellula limnantheis]|uniref:Regulatory protein BlaR1 n=1 Tax=Lacipirellula limnantheis TaxID=2528024 RepID=A0A517TY52_9BACT|nr:M56 family metallopeptidase [Lacipirellula limnantheis]QDT73300.1 Regulatory protein BlaR1 [Lacipirellula limnantheis]